MPANPSKDYAIFWNDGTYKTYTLKATDYKKLKDAIINKQHAVELSIGVLLLNDLREVVEQRPVKIQKDDRPAIPAELTADEKEYVNNLLREFYVHGVEMPFEEVD